jgi:hypothetical protein
MFAYLLKRYGEDSKEKWNWQFHDGGRFKTKLSKFESEQLSSIKAVEFFLVEL